MSPHSFDLFFIEKQFFLGNITLNDDKEIESVKLKDKNGRSIFVGFNESFTTFIVDDEQLGMKVGTYFFYEDKILMHEDSVDNKQKKLVVSFASSPPEILTEKYLNDNQIFSFILDSANIESEK